MGQEQNAKYSVEVTERSRLCVFRSTAETENSVFITGNIPLAAVTQKECCWMPIMVAQGHNCRSLSQQFPRPIHLHLRHQWPSFYRNVRSWDVCWWSVFKTFRHLHGTSQECGKNTPPLPWRGRLQRPTASSSIERPADQPPSTLQPFIITKITYSHQFIQNY